MNCKTTESYRGPRIKSNIDERYNSPPSRFYRRIDASARAFVIINQSADLEDPISGERALFEGCLVSVRGCRGQTRIGSNTGIGRIKVQTASRAHTREYGPVTLKRDSNVADSNIVIIPGSLGDDDAFFSTVCHSNAVTIAE